MTDLTDLTDPVASAIYEQYEKRGRSEKPRTYLGASIIGKECKRALWYDFRWASREQFDGRMYRLFQSGFAAEPRFIADLRAIGVEVHDVDPSTGRQFGFSEHGGHMKGHMDGAARLIPGGGKKWHVVEFKTHSAKSFADLKKLGVARSKPQHYDQMTWYMGKTGMDRALYLAVNKDSDELYAERLQFDKVRFEQIQTKAESIIFSMEPPAKLSDDPSFYICKFCAHSDVCHGNQVPAMSCRTCCYATPEREGEARWSCAHKEQPTDSIPIEIQRAGCNNHLPLPFLITYADTLDAGPDWILFQRKDNGRKFVVVTATGMPPLSLKSEHDPVMYHSYEISAAKDHRAICDPEIEKLRQEFDGKVVG